MIKKWIDNDFYHFNFGIKQLIHQKDFLNLNSTEVRQALFKDILIQKQESDKLLNILSDSMIEEIIIETFNSSFLISPCDNHNNSFFDILLFLLKPQLLEEVDQLYKKAVGEMQISPTSFWNMTPKEIELAYLGYLNRIELGANCTIAAAAHFKAFNGQLFSLLRGQEYGLSTKEERNKTFSILHIS